MALGLVLIMGHGGVKVSGRRKRGTVLPVVEKRESKSRPEWGIITFEHRAKNQHGELVMRCRRAAMMRRKTG